eukprot:CAMPEP_0168352350 /NCGR_PEP_ID=MMETSP0213-20121227/22507_1 /TAXON_ID=151035 /ORGANISM="Euplotes harpa, Strain FSP1.4" /LENGTH=237 /DNA_ID=CAMNT_0008363561 /DNA_START=176 /DNA_END=887 /DNA_ORIENTATION=+
MQILSGIQKVMREFRELIHLNPPIRIYGTVGLISTDLWIRDGTLRENIILEHEFFQSKYDRLTKVLNLEAIFLKFPEFDQSKTDGELSFSEKFMINLARVLYRDNSIIIIEDVLWKLDEYWRKIVIKSVILDEYSAKIGLELLKQASKVVYLERGRVRQVSTYQEMQNMKGFAAFKQLVAEEARQVNVSMASESDISISKTSNVTRLIEDDLKSENPLDMAEPILDVSCWKYFFLSK